MILRRIKAHVEKENWFAVGIDFAIVVVGVFMGLQVANWNEARALEQEKLRYLTQLSTEYQIMEQTLHNQVEDYKAFIRATVQVIETVQSDDTIVNDGMLEIFLDTRSGRMPPGTPPTLRELISSGKVDLINDPDLRTKFMTTHTRTENMARIFDLLRQELNNVSPVLFRYSDQDTAPLIGVQASETLQTLDITLKSIDLAAMRAGPAAEAAFETALNAHLNMLQVELFVLEDVVALNTMIAEELAP